MTEVKQQSAQAPKKANKAVVFLLHDIAESDLHFYLGDVSKIRSLYEAFYGPVADEDFEFAWRIMRCIRMAYPDYQHQIRDIHPVAERMIEMVNMLYNRSQEKNLWFMNPLKLYQVYESISVASSTKPIDYVDFCRQLELLTTLSVEQNPQTPSISCESWEIHFGALLRAASDAMESAQRWLNYEVYDPWELLNQELENSNVFDLLYSLYLNQCDDLFHLIAFEERDTAKNYIPYYYIPSVVSIAQNCKIDLEHPKVEPLSKDEAKKLVRWVIDKS